MEMRRSGKKSGRPRWFAVYRRRLIMDGRVIKVAPELVEHCLRVQGLPDGQNVLRIPPHVGEHMLRLATLVRALKTSRGTRSQRTKRRV